MTAKDYLKSKNIWLGNVVSNTKSPCTNYNIEELLDDFVQQLEILNLHNVIECSHPSTYWYWADEARTIKHCANCGAKNIL